MSTQEKFTAAINVIRSLPKNGAYQPSKDLLLRFYAYFKQATIGPNNQPKPSFWDVVNRAKWQAWYNLGDMSKENAMQEYVDELKKIVETMAYTNPVADFVSSLDSFYESVSIDDLEMVVGPIERGNLTEKNSCSIISINEHQDIADTEIDEECFHDVLESSGERLINVQSVNQYLSSSDYIEDFVSDNCIPISQQNGNSMIQLQCANDFLDEFKLQIRNTVSTMKYDLDIITNRVVKIELKLDEIKKTRERKHYQALYFNLFQIVVLLGWPIIVQLIFNWFKRQNRQKALNVKTL
ncbi:acyl-CoA-binding domain-containing protein 5 [Metopolophium dirhodum]|uniref:acyl-CoA-binding domain-containing protein 5 n=1 Tax=Metopolophium dirhodum TaxID=44670 RepID=UPI00298FF61F|nr:acyl-CoA-binding domain-containing protein 5 [Metopolophium dirhodum]